LAYRRTATCSRRIERAVALLRDSDLSITDIAFQTGWRSLGTFGRIFRDITGASPGLIRSRAKAAARGLDRVRTRWTTWKAAR
jgi:transcriptional regulator GlxA family with amidase domain